MGYQALVMENHMENKMEHAIKTRFISGAYTVTTFIITWVL